MEIILASENVMHNIPSATVEEVALLMFECVRDAITEAFTLKPSLLSLLGIARTKKVRRKKLAKKYPFIK